MRTSDQARSNAEPTLTPASLPLLLLAAAMAGFFLYGGVAGLYATIAISFTAAARASGAGFVIGVGRIGSAVAPLVAGWLFSAGIGREACRSLLARWRWRRG